MPQTHPERSSEMAGARVLVSGSGTGIGRAIGLAFASRGATVAFHYSHSSTGAESAVAAILAEHGKARAFKADFTRLEDVRALASDAESFLGGLDVLVNNAGITMNRPFELTTPEQFETLYAVNVRAPYFLTQSLLPALLKSEGGGTVINIASIHAYEGMQEHSVYAGTRGAIVSFTRQLAIELAPRGVRVNGIAPGAIEVENYQKAMPGFDRIEAGKNIPVGFVGRPDDIANAALFLASSQSRYLLGQTLIIDGGTTSWMPFGPGFREKQTSRFGQGYVPGV